MKKILRSLGWFCYIHEKLALKLFVVSAIGIVIIGTLAASLENLLFIMMGVVCLLIYLFFLIVLGFFAGTKNPKVAITEAQKILRENPQYGSQLNSFIEETKQKDDSTKLRKWLYSYGTLLQKEKKLAEIAAQLNKLPKRKTEIETEIKNLKSGLSRINGL